MRKIWNKGHRIRASDKHLVYHFFIGSLLFVFVAVLFLLNIKQLMRTDWEHFSGYIARLSMRKLYDERGNVYFGVDHDIRERLQAKLMMAVLTFKAEE